jgi:hypothetical protein
MLVDEVKGHITLSGHLHACFGNAPTKEAWYEFMEFWRLALATTGMRKVAFWCTMWLTLDAIVVMLWIREGNFCRRAVVGITVKQANLEWRSE